jgi:hypothetical protein
MAWRQNSPVKLSVNAELRVRDLTTPLIWYGALILLACVFLSIAIWSIPTQYRIWCFAGGLAFFLFVTALVSYLVCRRYGQLMGMVVAAAEKPERIRELAQDIGVPEAVLERMRRHDADKNQSSK